MLSTQEKIIQIFDAFHDGTLEEATGNEQELTLKISCQYLAELIDTQFEYFYLTIKSIHKLHLFAG